MGAGGKFGMDERTLAWRRGPKVGCSMPTFTPIGATIRV